MGATLTFFSHQIELDVRFSRMYHDVSFVDKKLRSYLKNNKKLILPGDTVKSQVKFCNTMILFLEIIFGPKENFHSN